MLLSLKHKQLPFYQSSLTLVNVCYKALQEVTNEERYGITKQIKRAAVSVALNISEGSARSSKSERKRFYEIARSSLVEVDTGFEILIRLDLIEISSLQEVSQELNTCFKQLTNLIIQLQNTE